MIQFVVAAIEGFGLQNDGFILRELTLIFPGDSEQHFLFKNPEDLSLNEAEMKTAQFTQKYLNRFDPSDDENCCLPYAIYPKILENIENCRIYCAGEVAHCFFTRNLPNSCVIDVYTLFDFSYPAEMDNSGCFKRDHYRYCSLAKARHIKSRLEGCTL